MCVPWLQYFEDPDNCGYCGNKCALPGTAVHGCEGGNCYPITCDVGFADCDEVWANGCEWTIEQELCNCVDDDCDGETDELPLADCEPPKSCVDCFCQCPKDDPNIMDCGETGCKNISNDPANCGWCDNICADMEWPAVKQYGCVEGQCMISGCEPTFFDTNEMPWDGCECEQTSQAELCDLLDNDCDGEFDEPPLSDCPPPLVCEFGICGCPLEQPNMQECIPGMCIDTYTNPKHCGFCDNKCEDLLWEHVMQYGCEQGMCFILACQPPWVDQNQMEFDGCECEKTSGTEFCDMIDNNCNGEIDEKPNNCVPPMVCLAGTCVCPPEMPNLQDCGNGKCTDTNIDNKNCGFCGNLCDLPNLAYQKCEGGQCVVTPCKPGWKDCNSIPSDGCEFEIAIEECNGFDDDCDGDIDEGAQGVGQPCDTGLPGLCSKGIQNCEDGSLKCNPNVQPGQYNEVCDGKDNDCDGQEDEGNPGGGGTCSVKDLKGECKTGVLECLNAKLECQQTVFPQPESCDGKDNDCDGIVDGIEKDCFTMCGDGKETCNNGIWGKCSAEEPKLCKNYDNCQMEEMCVVQCPSAPAEQCNGMDENCDGQVDETFACTIGEMQEQGCGNCGTQSRTCTGSCTWGGWSACNGQGECVKGTSKIEGVCGSKCGQQKWQCSNQCWWQQSSCVNEGQCTPWTTKEEGNCGNQCGKYKYTCNGSCVWQQEPGCVNEGICSKGSYKTEGSCGSKCGDQKWKCGNSCNWDKYDCINEGVCSSGSTKYEGSCGSKCGKNKYTCSGSCQWSKQSGCYQEGSCVKGSKQACDGCKAKVCNNSCQWGSCGSGNMCGSKGAGNCYCDSACVSAGDCCPGYGSNSACKLCGKGCYSCEYKTECNSSGGKCHCDRVCDKYGDCCSNSCTKCASTNNCGWGCCGKKPSGWNCSCGNCGGWLEDGCCSGKDTYCK